jgi:hypothetical protein
MSLLDIQKAKLDMKRELIEIERSKKKLLEGILAELRQKNCCCSFPIDAMQSGASQPASISVSPTIKGLVISEM